MSRVLSIFHPSSQGNHGARVKWFPRVPKSKREACLSVTIEENPKIFNLNLPQRIANGASEPVRLWVSVNHIGLLDFWNNGYSWTRQQVNEFIENLHKI